MKAVFLCAGYGTRLYPLTIDRPKALLEIAGAPLLNHLIAKLKMIRGLNEIILVSNSKFYQSFCDWKQSLSVSAQVHVIDDGTTSNENRLGAIRDLKLALDERRVKDDVLVLASDNLFDADITSFVSYAEQKNAPAAVGVFDVLDLLMASKYGIVKTDAAGQVTDFFEKPKDPPSTLASMGIYYLKANTLPFIAEYLAENKNPDAPGYYMDWLSKKTRLYAFRFLGKWFDIGDVKSYEAANTYFKQIAPHSN